MNLYRYSLNRCGPAYIVTVYEHPTGKIHAHRGFDSERRAHDYGRRYVDHLEEQEKLRRIKRIDEKGRPCLHFDGHTAIDVGKLQPPERKEN